MRSLGNCKDFNSLHPVGQIDTSCNGRCRTILRELVETEEEFSRDLLHVVEKYIKGIDKPVVPRSVRDNKDIIFCNFLQIAEFHNK